VNRARVRPIRVTQLPFCHGVPLVLRHVSSHCSSFGAACNTASGKWRVIGVVGRLESPVVVFGLLLVYSSVFKIAKIDFASSYISPSAWNNLAPTGRIFRKFHIEEFWKICRESAVFIKI
jgi:hypothetical protein